jgi:GTPase Era involved in 16S rRNA processing
MTEADPEELRLIEAADGIELTQVDLTEMTQLLEDWLSETGQVLADHRLQRPSPLRDTHALVHEVHAVNDLLADSAAEWTRKWALLEPAQLLARAFDDQVMLLVFGKFNAGKSSLCNLLAERFVAHERVVRYFHLEAGHVVRTTHPLQEGATETTARLQGVSLGHSLVLLDTPGLHSITPENAALTQRFTDSADAVLWLTSSTSPGQVQELDEMARELHRCKPLLPVITRSDILEEDEIDGDIVKLLRNKTPSNRRLQEDDVHARARDKLAQMDVPSSVLKHPVSISAHATRMQGQTPQALADGGFTRFYSAVLDLVEPARAYKQRKPVEVLLHHLEENVLGVIKSDVAAALHRLVGSLARERDGLQQLQPRMIRQIWRQVVPELPRLLDQHVHAHDVAELHREVGTMLQEAVVREVASTIGDYEVQVLGSKDDHRIETVDELVCASFGDMTEAGAGDGFSAGPKAVTLNHERLHDALQTAIRRRLEDQLGSIFKQCIRVIDELESSATNLQDALASQDSAFLKIKLQLRVASR